MTKQHLLTEKLEALIATKKGSIAEIVIQEALDHYEIEAFFTDLLQHGCISGMISLLVYYRDTHEFYDKHYAEIEELRDEYEEMTGTPLTIKGDLKNFYAWWSFETVAFQIWQELQL